MLSKKDLVFLTLIAGRKRKDALISMLSEAGARMISTVYGKGTVQASHLENALGLVPEENKVLISSVLIRDNADSVMNTLIEEFHFDKPNTGVAFTTSVDGLSF